jgi:hypothetical protein
MLTFVAALALLQTPEGTVPVMWRSMKGWTVDGRAISNIGPAPEHLFSVREYGDVSLHIEFKIPKNSNSGVYLEGRYEVQSFDSSGKADKDMIFSDCGSIYQRWKDEKGYEGTPARVNAFAGPDKWNSYDIRFRAPRFDAAGHKIENARFEEVWLNGRLIQKDTQVTGPTRAAYFEDEKPTGPIVLQSDHGPVEFRNYWVKP